MNDFPQEVNPATNGLGDRYAIHIQYTCGKYDLMLR